MQRKRRFSERRFLLTVRDDSLFQSAQDSELVAAQSAKAGMVDITAWEAAFAPVTPLMAERS